MSNAIHLLIYMISQEDPPPGLGKLAFSAVYALWLFFAFIPRHTDDTDD